MTISTTNNRKSYVGDGVSTAFAFPYLFLASADISVYLDGVLQTAGYSVSGAGSASGGTVTFITAPGASQKIELVRIPDLLQTTKLSPNDPFPVESVETMADKAMIAAQRVIDLASRSIHIPDGESNSTGMVLPAITARQSQLLGFDSSGLPTTYATGSGITNDSSSINFLQAGAGAVGRTTQDRMRESISITDYGAKCDGFTIDDAAIALAIAANPGKTILIPGPTKISVPIVISAAKTRLAGLGSNMSSILNATAGLDAVQFTSSSNLASAYLSQCGISGIYIYRSASSPATAGAAIRATQCSDFMLEDVITLDCPEGIRVVGGKQATLTNFTCYASTSMPDISGTANTALLAFLEAPCAAGTYQQCYTVKVSDFVVSANKRTNVDILVGNADGLQLSDGYVNAAVYSLLRLLNQRDTSYISAVLVDNVYFDGVSTSTGSQYICDIPADGFGSSKVYNVQFDNCFMGNTQAGALLVRKLDSDLGISNCDIANLKTWALDYQGTASTGNITVSGNKVNNIGISASGSGAFRVQDCATLTITGNKVSADAGLGSTLQLLGTISSVTFTGNTLLSGNTDLSNAATVARLVYGNNNSDRAGTSSSLMGLRVGNFAQDDTKALDWYEEGTFTPTLSFGGAAVGMTYTSQFGEFTRIGNRVYFSIHILLSAKGSSVGSAQINALPYTVSSLSSMPTAILATSMTAGVGDTALEAVTVNSTTTAIPYKIAAGTRTQLADTDFTNASDIRISGHYRV